MTEFEYAVSQAAQSWCPVTDGDPNTIDLYWHAKKVQDSLAMNLPATLPPKDSGIAIVERVESYFIPRFSNGLLRNCSPPAITQAACKLVDAMKGACLLFSGDPESYVTALYAWHGCINMAKLLRRTYNVPGGQVAYSDQNRSQGYLWLQDCWTREAANGNPWVRYGVSLARGLEINRKQATFSQEVCEHWVPTDSPYWVA